MLFIVNENSKVVIVYVVVVFECKYVKKTATLCVISSDLTNNVITLLYFALT